MSTDNYQMPEANTEEELELIWRIEISKDEIARLEASARDLRRQVQRDEESFWKLRAER